MTVCFRSPARHRLTLPAAKRNILIALFIPVCHSPALKKPATNMFDHYPILQQSIREVISRPDFEAALPPLSDQTWMKILTCTSQAHAENERLEFLGDALMYATIGRQLYAQVPNGSPHLYTCVRAALHSNLTFAMLAEKLDILAVSSSVLKALTRKTFGEGTAAPAKSRPEVKATADLFETVIGAYYLDHGFEALNSWVEDIYRPLIKVTTDKFNECRSLGA
ncbi:ribonuclease III domain-containing protein [Trametes polyzona]|nr:ribonuclease III domain-containing protein [Trametes polyzona]